MGFWDDHWKEFDVHFLVDSIKNREINTVQVYNRMKEMQVLRKFSDERKIKSMCDFGSGMGVANLVCGKDAICTLIDNSKDALEKAREFHKSFDLSKMRFMQADILKDFPNLRNKFDLTWNQGVFEHFKVEDQVRIFNNMLKITKLGGYVVIMVPNKWSTYNFGVKIFDFLKLFGHKGWRTGYEKPLSAKDLKLIARFGNAKILGIKGIVPFANAIPSKSLFLNCMLIGVAKIFEDTKFADWFGREIILIVQKT